MNKDLKCYVAFIVLPAIALAVGGVLFLHGEFARQQEGIQNWRKIRGEFMGELAQNVQGALKDSADGPARIKALLDLRAEKEERVKGVFLWKKGEGVIWQEGVSEAVRAAFPTNAKWHAVGSKSVSLKRGWTAPVTNNANLAVAWARPASGEVAGLEVDLRDNLTGSDPRDLFAAGTCIVALLFVILLVGGLRLVRAARRARTESARKTTFIDNLSHELKIPLAVVRMKVERLLAGKIAEPEKLQAAYRTIAEENGEVIRQVDDLLELVRTGKGTRRYVRAIFDLNLAVDEAAAALRDRFSPDGLEVKLAGGTVRVDADPDAVRQIIRNLLDNAAKYAAAKGPVEVAVAHAGGWARVTVADRGDGIPPNERERIFERFYRIDNDLTRTTGGTGIGLCLARCFARDMGGEVTADARPGGGSVFTLELPEVRHD